MNTVTRNITDTYMIVLSYLSNSDKLELIAKLSDSMRSGADTVRKRPNLRSCFKGDWSAVDADSLRNHDYHGRTHFDHIPNIKLEDWAQKSKYRK